MSTTVTSEQTPYFPEGLATLMRRGLENAGKPDPTFEDLLKQLAEQAKDPAKGFEYTVEEKAGSAPGVRHFVVKMADPSPAVAEAQVDRLPTIAADTSSRTYADFEDPIPLVSAELKKLGFDPATVQMSRWDEVTSNIGGHYTNHYLRVHFPNGHQEDYGIELTLRNPLITAHDIIRIKSLTAPPIRMPS